MEQIRFMVICSFGYLPGDQNFIKQLVNYDKDNMTDRILKKIGTYCSQADFQPEIIGRVSLAAKSLCMWVRAMEVYGRIYRVVEPKKQRLAQATSQLQEKQAVLAEAKAKLKEVGKFCSLKRTFWVRGICRVATSIPLSVWFSVALPCNLVDVCKGHCWQCL